MALPPGYPLNGPPVFDMGLILSGTATAANNNTADICNNVFKGITLVYNVTAIAAGSITFTIQGKDTASLGYFTLLASTAVAAPTAAPTTLTIYPGITPGANVASSGILPAFFRILVTTVTGPVTYTVSASLTT